MNIPALQYLNRKRSCFRQVHVFEFQLGETGFQCLEDGNGTAGRTGNLKIVHAKIPTTLNSKASMSYFQI